MIMSPEEMVNNWEAKYGGVDAAGIKKIKGFEDESLRLKQMFVDLILENRAFALKNFIERKI